MGRLIIKITFNSWESFKNAFFHVIGTDIILNELIYCSEILIVYSERKWAVLSRTIALIVYYFMYICDEYDSSLFLLSAHNITVKDTPAPPRSKSK